MKNFFDRFFPLFVLIPTYLLLCWVIGFDNLDTPNIILAMLGAFTVSFVAIIVKLW